MTFKPMKAPNELISFEPTTNKKKFYVHNIVCPVLASQKLDGIRCLIIKGEIKTRSLKPIVNKQINEKFQPLAEYSKKHNLILDGEIYCNEIPFSLISSCVMTQDFENKKSIKTWAKLCEKYNISVSRTEALGYLKFYCFDCVKDDNFDEEYVERSYHVQVLANYDEYEDIFKEVEQHKLDSTDDIEPFFEHALDEGLEGLILRSLDSRYKFGRGTVKEGLIYKVKPFETFDAVILGVEQATKVNPNAEKKINELGRSVTSKKKDDRICIEKASTFQVEYEGIFVYPVLAMTDKEKEEVWKNQEDYIGKVIEYKGMLVGSKDVPRHPTFERFREDI